MIGTHIGFAIRKRLDDEDKKLFANVFAKANTS
jgi:hypothetical protein